MLKRFIFILLASLLSSNIHANATTQCSEVEGKHEISCEEQDYQKVKEAVFAKVGPDFAQSFNEKYPNWCLEGLGKLTQHIDEIPSSMMKTNPPQMTVTIGAYRIHLHSCVVNIILGLSKKNSGN